MKSKSVYKLSKPFDTISRVPDKVWLMLEKTGIEIPQSLKDNINKRFYETTENYIKRKEKDKGT